MTLNTKTISYDNKMRLFWLMAIVSALSLATYFYAVNATARNVASRQNLERKMAEILTTFDAMEFKNIALRNNVTMELARQYGYHEVKDPLYISRGHSLSLSFNSARK